MEQRKIRLLVIFAVLLAGAVYAGAAVEYASISNPIRKVICGIFSTLLNLALAIASLVFMAAIAQYIYARNDPGKRKQAKDIMIHAVVGLIIAGLTKSIISGIGYVKGCS